MESIRQLDGLQVAHPRSSRNRNRCRQPAEAQRSCPAMNGELVGIHPDAQHQSPGGLSPNHRISIRDTQRWQNQERKQGRQAKERRTHS